MITNRLTTCLVVALTAVCAAQSGGGIRKAIQFARGTSAATIEGGVVRGDNDWYDLTAKSGQTMDVRITSVENNAVFQIYQPGYRVTKDDGMTFAEGLTLDKAGEGDDAMAWSGRLPVSGKYLIVVGGTRGNASYTLKVSIKP